MANVELEQTGLIRFLQLKSPRYYGKISELQNAIKQWLSYITQTFPHYTRHTEEHSIEMIPQLSLMLFIDNNHKKPVITNLSPTEAYILVVSAFLHDAGMVASDSEKSEILMSEAWRDWTTGQGGGAKRWKQVQAFLKGNNPEDETLRIFLYDLQTRFLLAEFIRKSHHLRTEQMIKLHEESLGRFAFGDPVLRRAISDVCVAHGLNKHELEDAERFPDKRDINGNIVNLRLMAVLIRIADLLDVSYDRACPLLLNAAAPLPANSMAHWTQYQRITHRVTAPEKIQITAECQNQNEHRYLRDWFQWLEDEIANAAVLSARWNRHTEWAPPIAILNGKDPTIKIRPAPGATYIFEDWKLELDIDTIFERLIYQINPNTSDFIRELIQNAY
jgi:hypothetical protein